MDLRDKAGPVYGFGNLRLGPGKQPIIHAGEGSSYTTSAVRAFIGGRGGTYGTTPARMGQLHVSRRRQQEVLLKPIKNNDDAWRTIAAS